MRIIFHIPIHIDRSDPSASQIRPQKLMAAFAELGYEVDVVEGYGAERRRRIADIKRRIRQGVRYDFLYSESSTMPTLLTERHHLPTYPFLDFGFFRFCKRHGIPIGLFYRDIHWRFANRGDGWKNSIATLFYRYDLRQYRKWLDVLFLPTLEMRAHIPAVFNCRVEELPSGCEQLLPSDNKALPPSNTPTLSLLYVGGLGTNYNLKPLLQAVATLPQVKLTLCCRDYDWDAVSGEYASLVSSNVKVVHESGEAVRRLYRQADLFAMTFYNDYIDFAAPYKFFETIGYGVPMLVVGGSWMGRFVERNHIGIVCGKDAESIRAALETIAADSVILASCREHLAKVAEDNTWQARCHQITQSLTASS